MNIKLKKVTIVAERLLKEGLLELLKEAGATGHTLTMCEGVGSKGVRASDWEGRNIQIDSIVPRDIADKVMKSVGEKYMRNYSIIAYLSDVEVLRSDKFGEDQL